MAFLFIIYVYYNVSLFIIQDVERLLHQLNTRITGENGELKHYIKGTFSFTEYVFLTDPKTSYVAEHFSHSFPQSVLKHTKNPDEVVSQNVAKNKFDSYHVLCTYKNLL